MALKIITNFPDFSHNNFNLDNYYKSYYRENIIVYAKAKNVSYPVNPGSPLTIKYVFKGEETYRLKNYEYKVLPNRFAVFNEKQKYSSRIDTNDFTESISVFFTPDFVHSILNSIQIPEDKILEDPFISGKANQNILFIEKLYKKDNSIVPILHQLRELAVTGERSEEFYNEKLYFLLEALLISNRKLYPEIERVRSKKIATRVETYRRLNIVRDYIKSCYYEKITLSDLSKAACMCKHHMLREFKKYYNITPYEYLKTVRLKASVDMLLNTNEQISDIAAKTGFDYLSSFTSAFNKTYNISPSALRKKSTLSK